MKVASLLDLAATKVAVVVERPNAKDYLDVDALLRAGVTLPDALAAARAVYGARFNACLSLKALTFFEEGHLGTLSAEVRQRLSDAARRVELEKLPVVSGQKGLADWA